MTTIKNKRGAPKSVTMVVNETELKAANNNIKQFLKTKIRPFARSGAYIPVSQEYKDHEAFIIVLEKNEK